MCALHSPNRRENQLGNSFDLSSKTSLEIRPTCRENQLGNPSELSRKSALKFVRFVQKIGLEIRPIVEKINHSLEIRPICWEKKQFWNCSDLSKKTAWKFARLSGKSAWKFVRLSRKWKIVRFVEKISLEFRPIVETISLSRQSAWKFARLSRKSPWKFVRLSRKSASKFVQGGGVCYLACYTVYTSHRAVQMCKDRFRVSPLDPYATNQHGPTQPTVRLYPLCSQLFRHRIGLSFKERTLVNSGFRCVKVA